MSNMHLLTRREVAELFGVNPKTIARWADQGLLPHLRTLGGHRRYPAHHMIRLARHLNIDAASQTLSSDELLAALGVLDLRDGPGLRPH